MNIYYYFFFFSITFNLTVYSQTTKFRGTASTIKLGENKWESWETIDRLITFDDNKGIIKVHSNPALIFYKTSSESSNERYIYYAIDEYDKPVQIIIEEHYDEIAIYIRYVEFILAFTGNFI
ncbi:hypothetical protein IF128_12815 [Empedobacter stercoris]|uniref:hypothetical protein n=1 Tax=Empedobacter stercoris TaxID=1628248 RepID=UPI0016623EBA|nr:hypothetical protein [Empedobacter stercoris]MCA4810611.1 hypothetical protein [Empedobacter stercoris]QNT15732.1 hypothetical protein HNV03_13570 [Empedobacter stercoris]